MVSWRIEYIEGRGAKVNKCQRREQRKKSTIKIIKTDKENMRQGF